MGKSDLDHVKILHAAEHLSKEKGYRWTEMRKAVFECVIDQDKPITAYQLIDQLSTQQNKNIKPASVYRSIDALCAVGLVVKIESLNAFMACAHPEHHHDHVFLVCRTCGSTDELADHSVSKRLNADATHQGFKIERQVLELQGACRECQI
jgi:Fur family transcriptional regulator, zinc uptake regulator